MKESIENILVQMVGGDGATMDEVSEVERAFVRQESQAILSLFSSELEKLKGERIEVDVPEDIGFNDAVAVFNAKVEEARSNLK